MKEDSFEKTKDFTEVFIEDMMAYLEEMTPEKKANLHGDQNAYIQDAAAFFERKRKERETNKKLNQ